MEPFIGQIIMFGGNFAPSGWAFCDGQLLAINQYTALFSLIGTTYGGNGETTFALPDLRGRAPIHRGQGPGLSNRALGAKGGSEEYTLGVADLPEHSHDLAIAPAIGTSPSPVGAAPAISAAEDNIYGAAGAASWATANVGGNRAINNMQPFLAISYLIATVGLYPSQP